MADLQISLKYSTPAQRIGFWSMCAFTPVWALLVPLVLGAFISFVLQNPALWNSYMPMGIILFLFGLMVFGIVGTAFVEDDTIYITKAGFAFPLSFSAKTRFRRQREWSELASAEVLSYDKGDNKLLLGFKDGVQLVLDKRYIKNDEMEKLLLAVELWGTSCSRSPKLIEYQRTLGSNPQKGGDGAGYTQIWEEELGRRFSTTNFIPLEPEQQLQSGKIKIVRQLAFGGLSAIYLAQKNQSELIVIKESVTPASTDEQAIKVAQARLEREFRILTQLDHPHITKVRDYFVENGRHYLVLQYVTGQDLRQLVRQAGPQPEHDVIAWGLVMCSVLEYLHGQDPPILHRDFTPDNIVRTNSGELVVIDFGAANAFLGAATGTLIGKQAYIAPEQLRGKGVPESDLYALGASLYFLLTGRDPKPLAVAHPKAVVPSVSNGIDELIARCTAFEAEERFASATEIALALSNLDRHKQQMAVQT